MFALEKIDIVTHYDKMLHVTMTFIAVIVLARILPIFWSVTITFILQCVKIFWNSHQDNSYQVFGDLMANLIGFGLAGIYLAIPY